MTYLILYLFYSNCSKIQTASEINGIDYYKENNTLNGTNRSNVKSGTKVSIVQKQDQRTGKLTQGIVKDILTKSPHHSRGIKVRLESGEIGRVQEILS